MFILLNASVIYKIMIVIKSCATPEMLIYLLGCALCSP